MTTIAEHWGLLPTESLHGGNYKKGTFIAGTEYEIESILSTKGLKTLPVIVENDHSLRNNGYEIKTFPLNYEESLKTFKDVHDKLEVGAEPFSERTSIHVHVNVRDLEMKQVRQLVLVYALLEPLFFDFVGPVRKSSIFCVPLNYTYLPALYKQSIDKMHDKWSKYTAFNILPLGPHQDSPAIGTIEFRHLYGTDDYEVYHTWLTALKQLFEFIRDNPEYHLLEELKKGATAATIAAQVIPILASRHSPDKIIEMTEDTLLDVKLAAGGLK